MKEQIGRITITIIFLGLVALSVYLIRRKINGDSPTIEWGGLLVLAVFALLFMLLSILTWWGVYFEKTSEPREAELLNVNEESVTLTTQGVVYHYSITCRWQEKSTGQWVEAKSPEFTEGQYYNRNKILVHVDPKKPEITHFVDLDYLSDKNENGIPILARDELTETRDAKLLDVYIERLGRNQDGTLQYFWKLSCEWQEKNGQTFQATSRLFDGTLLYYNGVAILVRVNPAQPNLNEVDISFISSSDKNGIRMVSPEDLKKAKEKFDKKIELTQSSPFYKSLRQLLKIYETNRMKFKVVYIIGIIMFLFLVWWRLKLK